MNVLPAPTREHLSRFFGLRLTMVAAITVSGVLGGAAGAAYMAVLKVFTDVVGPERWGSAGIVVVLAMTGVAIAALVRLLGAPAGVELMVDNIHVPDASSPSDGSRLRALLPISLLCISVGGPLGPEAPVVTTAGALSSRLGHRLDLSDEELRVVILTGMAAGFAVLFGAPLGAAIFALEIPHRRGIQYHEAIVPAAIGAAWGYAISVMVSSVGLKPVWLLPIVAEIQRVDLLWALLAGVLGGIIAWVFTHLSTLLLRLADYLPSSVLPAIGGLLLGGLALIHRDALTNGEFQLEALADNATVSILLLAATLKLAASAIAVATGWRGGFIIPLFFIGFCVGQVVGDLLPGATVWAFTLGLMAAANVGVTKTPIGSTLVISEMAGVTVLPTTLIASLTSLVITTPLGMIESQRERVDVDR